MIAVEPLPSVATATSGFNAQQQIKPNVSQWCLERRSPGDSPAFIMRGKALTLAPGTATSELILRIELGWSLVYGLPSKRSSLAMEDL